jgi:diguanylate cyclase (GGDEF)-like protein/PAS domain S-box-containing protein
MPNDQDQSRLTGMGPSTTAKVSWMKDWGWGFPAALVAIVALFAAQFWLAYHAGRDEALARVRNLSQLLAVDVENAFDRAQSDMRVIAAQVTAADLSAPVSPVRKADLDRLMDEHLRSFPAVTNYRIFDAQGSTLYGAGSGNPHAVFSVSDRDWFRQLRDDPGRDLVISEVLTGKGTNEQTIIAAVAVRDGQGGFLGAVNAALNVAYFQNLVEQLSIGRKGLVTIRRSDNYQMVWRFPAFVEQINKSLLATELGRRITAGEESGEGEVVFVLDHIRRSYAFKSLGRYPFTIIVAEAPADYLTAWRRQTAVGAGIAVLVMVFLTVLYRRQAVAHRRLNDYAAALRLAADAFTHAYEGIMITDADAKIIDVNEGFTRITGYVREEVIGRNPRFLQSGRQPRKFYEDLWKAMLEQGFWRGEIWNRRKSGEIYAEILTISSVRDAAGRMQNMIGLFTDITSLKNYQEQLERMAHYDPLTGLPNRALLSDRLQQAVVGTQRRGGGVAVMYIDLDGFKEVNDRHGHDVGDELLIAIAQRMKAILREGDTLARLGGDEFVALLVELAGSDDWRTILDRLQKAAAEPVTIGELELQVSASIGITLYPADQADAATLLRHADEAMYRAKQAGKNRHHLFSTQ